MLPFISTFADFLLEPVLVVISAILTFLISRATSTAKQRWNLDIEYHHRQALHSALMSGVRAALGQGASPQDAIASAIKHSINSVPDAIQALDPSDGVLASIAESKIGEIMGDRGLKPRHL